MRRVATARHQQRRRRALLSSDDERPLALPARCAFPPPLSVTRVPVLCPCACCCPLACSSPPLSAVRLLVAWGARRAEGRGSDTAQRETRRGWTQHTETQHDTAQQHTLTPLPCLQLTETVSALLLRSPTRSIRVRHSVRVTHSTYVQVIFSSRDCVWCICCPWARTRGKVVAGRAVLSCCAVPLCSSLVLSPALCPCPSWRSAHRAARPHCTLGKGPLPFRVCAVQCSQAAVMHRGAERGALRWNGCGRCSHAMTTGADRQAAQSSRREGEDGATHREESTAGGIAVYDSHHTHVIMRTDTTNAAAAASADTQHDSGTIAATVACARLC